MGEIPDGDVMAGLAALVPGGGIDLSAGIGGAPEGVITACAVRLLNPALEHPLTQEHLQDLLARTAQTGVKLDFDIAGDVTSIPGHIARATYRILQEGLTNAIRHAPGAAIWVSVACGDAVRLEIVNDPPPAGAVSIGQLGSGHGLTGLAERTTALGGAIHSGPVPDGGWRLSAELPATA